MNYHLVLTWTLATGLATFSLSAEELAPPRRDQFEREQIHMKVQAICPVSGQALGSHGTPVKVKVGEEIVFLCCKGCLKGQVDPEHWATIHANFAKAQRICPVMKHELPENPRWTIVEGQIFYVCCPPCTEKIEAEPALFLDQLEELYLSSLESKRTTR